MILAVPVQGLAKKLLQRVDGPLCTWAFLWRESTFAPAVSFPLNPFSAWLPPNANRRCRAREALLPKPPPSASAQALSSAQHPHSHIPARTAETLDGKSTGSPTSSFLLAADFRPSSALPGLEMLEPEKLRLSISMQPAKTRRSLEVGTLPLFPILCSRKRAKPQRLGKRHIARQFCQCRYTTGVLVFLPPVILVVAKRTQETLQVSVLKQCRFFLRRFWAASSLRRSSRLALSGALSCHSDNGGQLQVYTVSQILVAWGPTIPVEHTHGLRQAARIH